MDRLVDWKQSLLDPNDCLLDLRDDGIAIGVDPVRLAFALAAGSTLAFDSGVAGLDGGRLRVALAPETLARELAQLARAAQTGMADGEHVLWLALGELAWTDAGGRARSSPLALWPVELVPGDSGTRLAAAAGCSPRANDALLERLRADHGLALAGGTLDLAGLLDAAAEAAQERPGWRVTRAARLAAWSFARFDLWRDVEALGDDLAAHAPVAWLAGDVRPPALPAAPLADVLAPLDADASQLAAIAAAAAGGSFVLRGAPGTGKSQTIANIVADCTSRGKTVLVVSDRAAALDVVQRRLAAVGLADFCLALHGEPGRARVLESLARTLDRAFRPGSGPSAPGARLAELAAALDGHVAALHAPGALGLSLHEVLARLVELRTVPCAPLAERDAALLDRAGFARRRAAVVVLADAARSVEPVAEHPWRAAAPASWPDGASERAAHALAAAASAVDAVTAAFAEVAALVPGFVARTPDQLRTLGALADLASASPRPGAELLVAARSSRADAVGECVALVRARGGGAIDPPRDPAELIALATRHRALAAEVGEAFGDGVDDLAAPELWAQLKRWAQRPAPVRYMALRAARAEVHRVARAAMTDDAIVIALEAVIAERACRAALVAVDAPSRRWLGELAGDHPLALPLARIEAAVAWAVELRRAFDRATVAGGDAGRQSAWRALVGIVSAHPTLLDDGAGAELAPFARLADAVARWEPALAEVAAATGIAAARLGAGRDHLPALRDQVAMLTAAVGSLSDWARYHLARRAAEVAGVGPVLDAIERADLAAADLAAAWERATLVAWGEAELRVVAVAGGAAHHARAAELADLDRRSLQVAKSRVLARLAERVPRTVGIADVDPQIATLREARAASSGSPLSDVLAAIPELFARLAPCVLATPQAVARHLDPELAFDLVVFDETSRLPAAHALGALARARAAIVVGDPVGLWAGTASSRPLLDDARQPAPGAAMDGLLERALAAGWPERSLAVHYRSRHEELLAFANRRYYGDALALAPAAHRGDALGASCARVEGAPDATGTNRAEVAAVVAELARRAGDGRSFAVIAMARAQADALEAAIADARRADPAFDAALATASASEPLLVGTPDRLQGEERDVALISIGGAPDALGALALPGGERWLAVALTRARTAWQLFASFGAEAIAADAPAAARDLADLLASFAAPRVEAAGAPASPITAAIARALGERGWSVRHAVGVGPYRVDLAVVDPEDPARYVLAIEHDGLAYAGGRCARDRDRVRGEQLALRGWRLHRVWSLDWWLDPERELQRAHGAIVAAIAAQRQKRAPQRTRVARGSAPLPAPQAQPLRANEDTTPVAVGEAVLALAAGSGPQPATTEITAPVVRIPRGAIAIGPYIAASIPPGRRTPEDLFAPRHAVELGKIVEQVLAAEAPIHVELLARRAAAYFGIGKVDQRVVEQVRAALAGRGRFGDEHGIVWRTDQDPATVPTVRVPGSTASARRDIAEVPLSELAAAVRVVVERAHELDAAELVRGCARLLGFARMTDRVGERVALAIQLAAARQLIALDNGRARMP